MTILSALLTLASIYGFSLFLSDRTKIQPQTAPLTSICGAVVWLTVMGMLGQLWLGGVLWIAAGLGLLVWQAIVQKKQALKLFENAGFLLFFAAAFFLLAVYAVGRPMFYQWDEFTFWGSAAKVTFEHRMLYPLAQSNMVTTAYPPALPLLINLFQLFGAEFSEWIGYFAYAVFALACVCTLSGSEKSENAKNILLLAAGVLLPFFFEVGASSGVASTVLLNLQADLTLGALFGAILLVYYRGEKTLAHLVQLAVLFAALSLVKDMGLALGMISAGIIAVDILFAVQQPLQKRLIKAVSSFFAFAAIVVAGWFGWSKYVGTVSGENRFDLGSNADNQTLGMAEMMIQGVKELFGIGRTEQFTQMGKAMQQAYIGRTVCLLGSGVVVTAIIAAILLVAFLCGDSQHKKRVALYAVCSSAGFAAFWVFHWFLYLYVFRAIEGTELKDYSRYFMEYYFGWMLGALVLLAMATRRKKWCEFAAMGSFALFAVAFLLRGQTVNNFMSASPTFYQERLQIQQRAEQVNLALDEDERIYPIIQGDDGTRWYYYGYELESRLLKMYGGGNGTEQAPYQPTTAVTLTDEQGLGSQQYEVVTSQQDLLSYLKESGATVLLVDRADDYTKQLLQPYTDGEMSNSGLTEIALYRITWQGSQPQFRPVDLEGLK